MLFRHLKNGSGYSAAGIMCPGSTKYYILSPDVDLPFIYGKGTFFSIDQGVYSNLWHDRVLPADLIAKAELTQPKRKVARDLLSLNAGFVGTRELADLLKKSDVNTKIQFHPCEILYHTGERVHDEFYFLEFNCRVDAFDYENSIYQTSEGASRYDGKGIIESCSKLVIVEEKTNSFDIFFLENVGFFDPIVSDRLAAALIEKKIKGIKLTPLEEYTWSE